MDDEVVTFPLGVAKEQPVSIEAGLLVVASFLLASDVAEGDSFDLFFGAFVTGSLLALVLRLLRASVKARFMAFGLPLAAVATVGILFDDRHWLIPLWVPIVLFFGFGGFVFPSRVRVGDGQIACGGLGFGWKIAYSEIEGIRQPSESIPHLRIVTKKRQGSLFQRTQEIPILLNDEGREAFTRELERRLANSRR